MPTLIGGSRDAAVDALEFLGFTDIVVDTVANNGLFEPGQVESTDPQQNETVRTDQTVTIRVYGTPTP